ncbi:MAG: hypothetical protein UV38_C0001G0189 [candidate division TM6 bacterium GW2011_GWE2_42_60]|nr:MAG: hypothetical protein UV38_C0001G0189 [candidate division TM6 bacterium GW2011_GWE2_42_60]
MTKPYRTSFTNHSFSPFSSTCIKVICLIILAFLLSFWNITHIQGSLSGIFAFNQSLYPLIGMVAGPLLMSLWGFLNFVLHFSFSAAICKTLLAAHLASSCGMLYAALIASSNYLYFKRGLCAAMVFVCGIAFIIHPVGRFALLYPCFWFIPLIIAFIPKPSIFLTALGSTFACHAVGSVLWLYAGKIPSALAWNNLIPVVASERLIFALGSCIIGMLFATLFAFIKSKLSFWLRPKIHQTLCVKNKI